MKKVVLVLAMVAVSIPVFAVELGIYRDDLTKVTLFGEIRTRFSRVMESDHSVNKDEQLRFSMDSSRLGVQGTHKLSDTTKALGYIRLRYDDDERSSKNNRFNVDQSWMGIATGFGTFKIGRIGSIQDDDMSFYDVTSQLGMEISPHNGLSGTGVQDGVLEYGWNNDHFSVRAQYFAAATQTAVPEGMIRLPQGPGMLPTSLRATFDNGYAFGASGTAFGLGLHIAYTAAHVDDFQLVVPGTLPIPAPLGYCDRKTLSLGVSFNFGGLLLAAVLSDVTTKSGGAPELPTSKIKADDLGLSAKYAFNFGLGTYFVYEKSNKKAADANAIVDQSLPVIIKIEEQQYTGGIEYWPLKKVLSFAELSQVKTKGVKKATAAWAVGTRFYF